MPGGRGARIAARVAWGVCALLAPPTLVLLVLGTREATQADTFGLTGAGGLAFLLAGLSFATTGALVAARLPAHPVGWLFSLIGLVIAGGNFSYHWADYALLVRPGALPAGEVAAVLQNLGFTPAFGLLAVAVLLFPDGRLPSGRWVPAAAMGLLGCAGLLVGYGLRSGPLDPPFGGVENPLGVIGAKAGEGIMGLGWLLSQLAAGAAGVAVVRRLRRARGAEREQLKWIALAGAVAGVVLVANLVSWFAQVDEVAGVRLAVVGLAFAALPVAAGVAILRHRLYDIDVVVNRALVYGALTATLLATYLGCVLLLQLVLGPLTGDSGLAVASSTLAVAALFRPARARIQAAVDRRFYRRKYDAQRTLETFAARLRDELALEALDTELRGVVTETMQPASVGLWLREPEARR